MPNIKSAAKRVKVIETKTRINNMKKSALKTSIKKAVQTIGTNDTDSSESTFRDAVKLIDKAVASGILHKNNAARKKSKLQKSMNKIAK